MAYDYSSVRALVRKHHKDADQLFGKSDIKQSTDLVDFKSPELIITQNAVGTKYISCTYLQKRVSYAAIVKFLELNRNLIDDSYNLRDEEDRMKNPSDFKKLKAEKYLFKFQKKYDADVIEFDDEENCSELMYSIILNR
jgi:hypothetical protein